MQMPLLFAVRYDQIQCILVPRSEQYGRSASSVLHHGLDQTYERRKEVRRRGLSGPHRPQQMDGAHSVHLPCSPRPSEPIFGRQGVDSQSTPRILGSTR
jgi:hypothetical protein